MVDIESVTSTTPLDWVVRVGFSRRTNTVSRDELLAQLDAARTDGFAVQTGEWEGSLASVAAPVMVRDEVVAALVVFGPASRLTPERLREIGPRVAYFAGQIGNRAHRIQPD